MKTETTQETNFDDRLNSFLAADRLEHLRGDLAARAQGELEVRWFTHETPVGQLLLAAHQDHVIRVAFEAEDFAAVHEQLLHHFGGKSLRTDRGLEFVRHELDEYFSGRRRAFEVPVAFSLSRGDFRVAAQRTLPHIAYGTTLTYAQLAREAGRPAAVRAAASACATNPLPILVPCHRVVRSDGTTGAYLGGAAAKKWLLEHESTQQPQ